MSSSKVFLDRNVLAHSILVEAATQEKRILWGDQEHLVQVAGWQSKKPLNGGSEWVAREISCLPTIAKLSACEKIKLFQSEEIVVEGWKASVGARGTNGDIFSKVKIETVPCAIDRSYFMQTSDFAKYIDKNSVIEFCNFLNELNVDLLKNYAEFWSNLPDWMRANLQRIDRFHELLNAVASKNHWADALHLWTAETIGADFFLTFDRKFINVLTRTAIIELPTKLVHPSRLLSELGIEERVPLPFQGCEFIDFHKMID